MNLFTSHSNYQMSVRQILLIQNTPDMTAKSLNAMIDGKHQLVVKAQYGASACRNLGNHSQLTLKSAHSSPTYQRSNIEQIVSSPNFSSNEYQTFSRYSNMGY